MRRLVIIASLVGSLTVFALSIDLFDALFMFIFFGVIPGRVEPLPAFEMLMVYSIAGLIVVTFALRGWIAQLVHSLQRKTTQANVS
jgi:hypothetical protein